MLRVLSLSSAYPNRVQTGLGNFVEQQLCRLAQRPGVEVEVVAPLGLPPYPLRLLSRFRDHRSLPLEEIHNCIRVHRPRFSTWPNHTRIRPAVMARALLPALRIVQRRFPFDVLHAEFFWPDGPAAMWLAQALGVPYSIKARGAEFERAARGRSTRKLALEAGEAAKCLLAVSDSLRSAMIAFGLPPDRIAVHRTGIDRSIFHPRDRAEAKAALRVNGPLLLNVGNLIARKRQRLAIEALRFVEEATLMVVGGGPDYRMLEAYARDLGLEGRVRMMGRVPQALLPHFYAAADVTVHTAAAEGLANVWIESMACGTPVVATDAGGAREVIDRSAAGRVVAADPAAIAAAVRELLAAAPAQGVVASAVEGFSWERNAAELEAHLRAAATPALAC